MNTEELASWTAGMIEGVGVLAATIEQGPSGREYAAIGLYVAFNSPEHEARLSTAMGNGGTTQEYPTVWQLGGYAAIKGFLPTIWPFLTPSTRSAFNAELRKFKQMKAN